MQLNGLSLARRRSRVLEGVSVTTTGLGKGREEVERLVRGMGGTPTAELDEKTTYLVAASALSEKFRKAPLLKGTTVVSESWPLKCWEVALRLDAKKFRVAPLAGARVAVSGFSGATKDLLRKRLEAVGATFTPSFQETNSHLIAASSSTEKASEKVTAAREWRVPVVDCRWLDACEKEKRAVSVEPYRLRDVFLGGQLQKHLEKLQRVAVRAPPAPVFSGLNFYLLNGDEFKSPFWLAALALINKGFGTVVPKAALVVEGGENATLYTHKNHVVTHVVHLPNPEKIDDDDDDDTLPPAIATALDDRQTNTCAAAVTPDWLVDSLRGQTLLPTDSYAPPPAHRKNKKRRLLA
mmetsp:Transcript_28631/g.92173  ORF Transcript_28631/g.92173 Transcript_28631/m.92173 type:complete len:352 (+) Transcript_28631:44-1099(+)